MKIITTYGTLETNNKNLAIKFIKMNSKQDLPEKISSHSQTHVMWTPEEHDLLRLNLDKPIRTLHALIPNHTKAGIRVRRSQITRGKVF
jgi:hypothetical protein